MYNGWEFMDNVGQYGTDYLWRAVVALAGLGANLPEDAIYPRATKDLNGEPLNGSNLYEITFLKGKKKTASELMPRVHRVISLLKRWLMGTHQGAVSHKHLDYYLDEFTFRFNRRRSKSRGQLFFRLAQQALTVDPVSRYRVVHPKLGKAESKTR